nr:reducing polyketide synthase hmp8 [Quercus suber]
MENTRSDDIAIVGLACRYPGEACSPDGFLSMLKNGRAAWSKIPKDRFDIDKYHHPSHERQGNIITRGGYFLKEDVGLFDAPFFSMTAAEGMRFDRLFRRQREVQADVDSKCHGSTAATSS